jgi:hypothetical protein
VAVPADTPLIAPVVVLMVATAGVPLLQVPPDAVLVKVLVPPMQISCVPLNVPAFGGAVTVMFTVSDLTVMGAFGLVPTTQNRYAPLAAMAVS